jgi:hypothetical protein
VAAWMVVLTILLAALMMPSSCWVRETASASLVAVYRTA